MKFAIRAAAIGLLSTLLAACPTAKYPLLSGDGLLKSGRYCYQIWSDEDRSWDSCAFVQLTIDDNLRMIWKNEKSSSWGSPLGGTSRYYVRLSEDQVPSGRFADTLLVQRCAGETCEFGAIYKDDNGYEVLVPQENREFSSASELMRFFQTYRGEVSRARFVEVGRY